MDPLNEQTTKPLIGPLDELRTGDELLLKAMQLEPSLIAVSGRALLKPHRKMKDRIGHAPREAPTELREGRDHSATCVFDAADDEPSGCIDTR